MILVGQNIQCMSKRVKEAVNKRNAMPIKKLAKDQADAGADYLDINLCSIMTDIVGAMQWAIDTVQDVVDLPLLINTTNPEAMEAGLKQCRKRPVINSANGMQDNKKRILPLAAEYPADVILGTYDEQGAPPSGEERATLAMELVEYANEIGIKTENIWIDPAVYPLSTNQEHAVACIEFMQMINDVVPGVKTVTGISNISSGACPQKVKKIINTTFFIILERCNQYAGIIDTLDKDLVQINRGELPEIVQLIHRVMDEEEIDMNSFSLLERAYAKATCFLVGKEPYSQSALAF